MTPREQLFSVLSAKDSSIKPFWLLFPFHPTNYYVDVRHHPDYRRVHQATVNRGIILDRRNFLIETFAPEVKSNQYRVAENGTVREGFELCYQSLRLYQERVTSDEGVTVKKLLNSEDDLDLLLQLPVLTDRAAIRAQLDQLRVQYLQEKAEFPAEYGAMMLDLGEPVNFVYHMSNLEEFSIWSVTCPEKVETFLERKMAQIREIYAYCLDHDLADVYFMVGSELASPPMFSRATFQRWIVPYAQELIAMIHTHGKFAIQHYHGQIREILPDFLTMNPDGLHTIESPPTGNCTLEEAFEIVGDRIALIGNIQYDDFRAFTPPQMRQAVLDIRRRVAGKRFILSPTAGPFDPAPPPELIDNYLAFIDACCEKL